MAVGIASMASAVVGPFAGSASMESSNPYSGATHTRTHQSCAWQVDEIVAWAVRAIACPLHAVQGSHSSTIDVMESAVRVRPMKA
jgi:hypothetical protein